MRPLPWLLLLLFFMTRAVTAQTAPAASAPAVNPPAPAPAATTTPAQSAADRLAQSNRELLDLLKNQQAVLEDIQYDRRLQSRQIQSLEERLEETLQENSKLQNKIDNLEAAAALAASGHAADTSPGTTNPPASQTNAPPPPVEEPPPPPPSTFLPPPESPGAPGTKSWVRLFTLSGTDGKNTDIFHVEGRTWRVLWHNSDKPGKAFENTSALFIHAFPKDDTIPQQVCAKVGTGGDGTELIGPGNYYLKIEASGGAWELAVEDFR